MERLGKAGLAAAVLALMLLLAVPYGRATFAEYRRFADYVRDTVGAPTTPPAWEQQVLSPEACVDETTAWVRGCPGNAQFCRGAMPDIARRCLQSQDRTGYCAGLGDGWMSTHFGFEACEAKAVGQDGSAAKLTKKYCDIGYRAIANHCRAIAADGPGAP